MPTAVLDLQEHPWSTFDKSDPAKHWVAKADAKNRRVHCRRFVKHIPIVGVRVYAHEIEHLTLADFTSDADHHDDKRWEAATGQKRHYCGRGFSWKGFLSLKHLSSQSKRCARELIKTGKTVVVYEEGSLLHRHHQTGVGS